MEHGGQLANRQSAANQTVRSLLTALGEYRDSQVLGIAPGELRGKKIRASLLAEFQGKCAYCSEEIVGNNFDVDHLVPMNKSSGGLHMYGNLVLSCKPCNAKKHFDDLDTFLKKFPEYNGPAIRKKLLARAAEYGADMDRTPIRTYAERIYHQTQQFLDDKIGEGIRLLPEHQTAPKLKRAAKVEHDFTEIARAFPPGSIVRSTKDDTTGVVFDYSMEGPKGKRTSYVRFRRQPDEKAVTRSPSTLEILRRF